MALSKEIKTNLSKLNQNFWISMEKNNESKIAIMSISEINSFIFHKTFFMWFFMEKLFMEHGKAILCLWE